MKGLLSNEIMKGLLSNEMIANATARTVLALGGNRPEAHLTEEELAAWIKAALDTRDGLVKSLKEVS